MNAEPRIVAIGEVLWDVYPERAHLGGAPANVLCHAATLGADAWLVSAVGADALGDSALEALEARGVHCDCVRRDAAHSSGQVRVMLDPDGVPQYEITADAAWDHIRWSGGLTSLAEHSDAICFGSLGQRASTSRATIRRFVESAPATSLRMFDVNLRLGFHDAAVLDASLRLASAVKLNDEELPVVANACGIADGTSRDMLRAMMERYHLRLAALTRGACGALLLDQEGEDDCAAPECAATDTVGAGDAFTATLMMGVLRGLPLGPVNRHANAVAAWVSSQPGATPVIPEHLRQLDFSSSDPT